MQSPFPDAPPCIVTRRLSLRAIRQNDAPRIQKLAGEREIAATTMTIPHPYPDGAAEEFIEKVHEEFRQQKSISLAITELGSDLLIGTIGLMLKLDDSRAELGYWIGLEYWGRGLVTEAAEAVVAYAFSTLQVNRVWALHFHTNPASGAVMQKLGMQHEGVLRKHARKWGEFVDYHCYGILRDEWYARRRS